MLRTTTLLSSSSSSAHLLFAGFTTTGALAGADVALAAGESLSDASKSRVQFLCHILLMELRTPVRHVEDLSSNAREQVVGKGQGVLRVSTRRRRCNIRHKRCLVALMSSTSTNLRLQILRCALPLIHSHGFTRKALASAALSLPTRHSEPLSDTAVSSLFGSGDSARMTLINYWLDEGRTEMSSKKGSSINAILKHRLQWNEPALSYLPEVS